jgi:hypothetical protein
VLAALIFFWCSPTSSASAGGRLCQGGKEKFVTRLAFRQARGQGRNEQAQTSLKAYRVEFLEPLTEYPGTDNEKVGTSKSPIEPALLCFNSFTMTINAKKPLLLIAIWTAAFGYGPKAPHNYHE